MPTLPAMTTATLDPISVRARHVGHQLGIDSGYLLAGLPLSITGFAHVRDRIAVLEEQRAAAVSAEAAALRRLERDIHDGPQQRLVRLALDLGRAQRQLDNDPDAVRRTLDEALALTRETLDELRALSRGIAPPVLVDRGLPSALAALAGRSTVPVELA